MSGAIYYGRDRPDLKEVRLDIHKMEEILRLVSLRSFAHKQKPEEEY